MNKIDFLRMSTTVRLTVLALFLLPVMPIDAALAASRPTAGVPEGRVLNVKRAKPSAELSAGKTVPTTVAASRGMAMGITHLNDPQNTATEVSSRKNTPVGPTSITPSAAITFDPLEGSRMTSMSTTTGQTANPYLAGWYRPVPASALPMLAAAQINDNIRYVSERVTSLPSKLFEVLPRIKTLHSPSGRDIVVANLKCPAEMMTGQYMLPANAIREGVNGLLSRLNDTQMLKFDIQLVCS